MRNWIWIAPLSLMVLACGSAPPEVRTPDTTTGGSPDQAAAANPAGDGVVSDHKDEGYGYEFNSQSTKDAPAAPPAEERRANGRLAPEAIQAVVQQSFPKMTACYEPALAKNPTLEGVVKVSFVIEEPGTVANAKNDGSTLPDTAVVDCVIGVFAGLTFPLPKDGIVTVVYPVRFAP